MCLTNVAERLMRRCLTLLLGSCWIPSALALTPVIGFDLDRYLGTWYEIAAIPGFLQSRCARDTNTEYSVGENGAIAVTTRCLRADGTPEINHARARPLEPALPSVSRSLRCVSWASGGIRSAASRSSS